MDVAGGKGAALVGELGHPGAAAASARPRSDRDIAPSQKPTAPGGSATWTMPSRPTPSDSLAERMGAATKSIAGSHTAFIAQPVAVAGFITEALATA
jgi:hypothetical protein